MTDFCIFNLAYERQLHKDCPLLSMRPAASHSHVWHCLTQGGAGEEQSGDLWGHGVTFV